MSRRNCKRWVYLIGSPDVRMVKIGMSADPKVRLEDMQTGSPVRLHLLWQTPGGRALEAALHAYFAAYRTHGEWFDFGDENPAALVATAAVLLGYRSQPQRVSGELRYRRSDCDSCAGRRVDEVADRYWMHRWNTALDECPFGEYDTVVGPHVYRRMALHEWLAPGHSFGGVPGL